MRPKVCAILADHQRCRCRHPAQQPRFAVVQCPAVAHRGPWWLRALRRQLPSRTVALQGVAPAALALAAIAPHRWKVGSCPPRPGQLPRGTARRRQAAAAQPGPQRSPTLHRLRPARQTPVVRVVQMSGLLDLPIRGGLSMCGVRLALLSLGTPEAALPPLPRAGCSQGAGRGAGGGHIAESPAQLPRGPGRARLRLRMRSGDSRLRMGWRCSGLACNS